MAFTHTYTATGMQDLLGRAGRAIQFDLGNGFLRSLIRAVGLNPAALAGVTQVLECVEGGVQGGRRGFSTPPLLLQLLGAASRPFLKLLLWPPFLVGSLLAAGAFSAHQATASLREHRSTMGGCRRGY